MTTTQDKADLTLVHMDGFERGRDAGREEAAAGIAELRQRLANAEDLLREALGDLNDFPAPHRAPEDHYGLASRIRAALAQQEQADG